MLRQSMLRALLLWILWASFADVAAVCAAEQPFAVIVGPGVSERRLSTEEIALIYRRKQNFWADGKRIHPVNLPPSHPSRRSFSLSVLGLQPEALEEYWREMYFHGILPPHVLASEKAVLLFVGSTPGAIGYVSSCLPETGVRVVLTVGELLPCSK